jgi:hypothetical protein
MAVMFYCAGYWTDPERLGRSTPRGWFGGGFDQSQYYRSVVALEQLLRRDLVYPRAS